MYCFGNSVSSWFSLVFAVWIWLVVVFAPVFFSICICVGQDNLGGSKLAKTVARFSGSSGNWRPSIPQNSHLKKYWNKPEIILLGHDSDVLCKTNPTLHSILGEARYWHTKKSKMKIRSSRCQTSTRWAILNHRISMFWFKRPKYLIIWKLHISLDNATLLALSPIPILC